MILCVGPTPAVQRVMVFKRITTGAVNRAAITIEAPSGKSINVAKVLWRLGVKPLATGFLGGARGDWIGQFLDRLPGFEHQFVAVEPETRQCATVIDEQAGMQTELVEESKPIAPTCSALVMSGTLTPAADEGFYRECVEIGNRAGAITVVDARGPALINALEAKPFLVKPNRSELAATLNRDLSGESDIITAMRGLISTGAKNVVVTAGSEATFACDSESAWKITNPAVKPVNPIGSGDAFTAGLVSALVQGRPLSEASNFASAVGAANALTLMPGEIDRGAIDELFEAVRTEQLSS
jgi:tagatose 6-phosphate kinase